MRTRRQRRLLATLAALLVLAASAALGVDGDDLGTGGVVPAERAGRGGDRGAGGDRSGAGLAPGDEARAEITRVIDGDTVEATLGHGAVVKVRLLGIDTPERTALRSGSVECGGEEATDFARTLARRRPDVVLRTDPTQDTEDRYGRLLAYIDVDDGPSYQEELLAGGWAKVYVYDRPPGRTAAFRAAAGRAEAARRGVWERCGGDFRRPEAR